MAISTRLGSRLRARAREDAVYAIPSKRAYGCTKVHRSLWRSSTYSRSTWRDAATVSKACWRRADANSRRSRRATAPRMTDERRAIWPRIIRRASTDFDEFARWVEGTEILRRMKGPCRAELTSADLGALSITRWSHTAPFIASSVVGANQRVFFVQAYGGAPVLVNGHALDERRILDHPPGAEIRIASRPGPPVQI